MHAYFLLQAEKTIFLIHRVVLKKIIEELVMQFVNVVMSSQICHASMATVLTAEASLRKIYGAGDEDDLHGK